MMKSFLSSKKAWGLILGAITLQVGAYFHADPAFYVATGLIFAAHQGAQGMQDHALAMKG